HLTRFDLHLFNDRSTFFSLTSHILTMNAPKLFPASHLMPTATPNSLSNEHGGRIIAPHPSLNEHPCFLSAPPKLRFRLSIASFLYNSSFITHLLRYFCFKCYGRFFVDNLNVNSKNKLFFKNIL